jgi:hypothetical protein
LRKAIATVVVAVGCIAALAGSAFAVTAPRCGTKYSEFTKCTPPKVHYNTPSPGCVNAGPSYKLPTMTFTSVAGIRKIHITLNDPTTIYSKSFAGLGPQQYTVKGVKVKTRGLKAGAHHVTIAVTDVKGKSLSRTLRFAICQAKPIFTG